MEKSKFFIIILIIFILGIGSIGEKGALIENLAIPVGVGNDLEKSSEFTNYNVSILTYSFEEGANVTSTILSGKAKSIGESRENRQIKSGKRYLLGLERVFVTSEEAAKNGMRDFVDIWLNNPELNDRSLCVICKGKAEDIFKYKVKGYKTSADFIEGMVQSLRQFNFFPMQYSIIDVMVRLDAEGRNVLLPYIELTKNGIETTGLAVFKGDNMVGKVNLEDARIINILKENNVKGVLTIQKSPKEYINFYATSKRKIKCYKEEGQLKFIVDLNLKGSIVSNELYKDLIKDSSSLKKFENDMQKSAEKMLNDSANRLKCIYETDVFGLGKFAAAKYGRHTGVDWNEVICKSDIKVNVKVKVVNQGRGDY